MSKEREREREHPHLRRSPRGGEVTFAARPGVSGGRPISIRVRCLVSEPEANRAFLTALYRYLRGHDVPAEDITWHAILPDDSEGEGEGEGEKEAVALAADPFLYARVRKGSDRDPCYEHISHWCRREITKRGYPEQVRIEMDKWPLRLTGLDIAQGISDLLTTSPSEAAAGGEGKETTNDEHDDDHETADTEEQ